MFARMTNRMPEHNGWLIVPRPPRYTFTIREGKKSAYLVRAPRDNLSLFQPHVAFFPSQMQFVN